MTKNLLVPRSKHVDPNHTYTMGVDPAYEGEDKTVIVQYKVIRDGQPCGKKGCLSNLAKPCDRCGRTAGVGEIKEIIT